MTKAELIRKIIERKDYRFTHDEMMKMPKKTVQMLYDESIKPTDNNVVKEPQRTRVAITFQTIFGNTARVFVDNIEELIFHPTNIAEIITDTRRYIVPMEKTDFDILLNQHQK